MKPIIVIDFDDVLVDFMTGYINWCNDNYADYGPKLTYEDVWTFELDKLHKIGVEERNQRVMNFWRSPAHQLIQPMPDAIEAMMVLADRGYDIHMATARAEAVRTETMILVDRYFADTFADMHFIGTYHEGGRRTKADVCNELGAIALIDDNAPNLLPAANGVRRLLMPDRPWNKNARHKEIIRTFGWAQALTWLERELF